MFLQINNPLVSADWLYNHLSNKSLIILDCTIDKATSNKSLYFESKKQIVGSLFFDIKNTFSDSKAPFPNTVLSSKEFEEKAQILGIQKDSTIIVYDDLGIYSSPRVWWMFSLMGFKNIAVLNGGLPAWKARKYPVEFPKKTSLIKGNFTTNYKAKKLKFTQDVLSSIETNLFLIIDARSKGRFNAIDPEPRKDVKSGHIPTSLNLPYSTIIENGFMKSTEKLKEIYSIINPTKKDFIFTCGTGITASVLAFGATLAGIENHAVYDGSWTEFVNRVKT